MTQSEPRSPCISVCVLDEEDVCTGCYRTAGEIAQWVVLDVEGKQRVLRRASDRRHKANPITLG